MRTSLLLLLVLPAACCAAESAKSEYRGWPSLAIKNDLIEVQVVPDIGGRVIQLKLGERECLWVNDKLAGKPPTANGLAPDGGWLNYGGDKVWPAPQGWDNEEQWPGPPDAVLDGSPHTGSLIANGVRLLSQKDKRSGVQFARDVTIPDDGAAKVQFDSTMTNVDDKPRRWSIWQVTQLSAEKHDIRQYAPLNPRSIFPRGYVEMFGLINNPSFRRSADGKMLVAHFEDRVGKVGVDNSAGWIATVDGTDGYAFVERFEYRAGEKYPDDTSAQFWLNGAGQFVCGTTINTITEADLPGNRLVESEVLSPMASLKPGESYRVHNEWAVARIGGNFPVLECTSVGVTCVPLAVKDGRIIGRFGVFYRGKANVIVGDKTIASIPVTPTEPLVLDVAAPPGAKLATVVVEDGNGKRLGELK